MPGETDLPTILTTMRIERRPAPVTVVELQEPVPMVDGVLAVIDEGVSTTVIATLDTARQRGWTPEFVAAWLTVSMQTSPTSQSASSTQPSLTGGGSTQTSASMSQKSVGQSSTCVGTVHSDVQRPSTQIRPPPPQSMSKRQTESSGRHSPAVQTKPSPHVASSVQSHPDAAHGRGSI